MGDNGGPIKSLLAVRIKLKLLEVICGEVVDSEGMTVAQTSDGNIDKVCSTRLPY